MERDTLIQELNNTARKRLERCGTLLSLAVEQKSILLAGRHSELQSNLEKHDPLLLEVRNLEKQEDVLRGRIAEIGVSTGAEYTAIRARIAESAESLRDVTITNRQLLTSHMEYVNFSLGVIVKIATEHSIVGPENNPAILLDSRV